MAFDDDDDDQKKSPAPACSTCIPRPPEDPQALSKALTKQFGVRPRNYRDAFDGSNASKKQFAALLPEVTEFVNERIKANGYHFQVTQAELATNMLSEGLYMPLENDTTANLSGYDDLGIDTLYDNRKALKPWLTDSLNEKLATGEGSSTFTNEKGEKVTTLRSVGLEDGMYANAGTYANAKAILSKDLAAKGIDLSAESPSQQMFWATT